jgi:hypothetical protein
MAKPKNIVENHRESPRRPAELFLPYAGFGASFNGAIYPDEASLNASFSG